ncbi:hypothetical protein HPB47_001373 [Ixodes persulcatus]|uniref:Uncharacterized protein n=1 Tax=Ixodes persulcatus TaxID=34615 RepID=A0AC60PP96_IXOPE|nr:hypothetical protein HPB47_001373 [Ixodes persulcatus]
MGRKQAPYRPVALNAEAGLGQLGHTELTDKRHTKRARGREGETSSAGEQRHTTRFRDLFHAAANAGLFTLRYWRHLEFARSTTTGRLTLHTSTTPHTLGSDHYIISTCLTVKGISTTPPLPPPTHTDWDLFRTECPLPPTTTCESDLEQWTTQLLSAKQIATKTIDPPHPAEYVDTHLRNLWEAYTSIEQRWPKHRHRRKLRLKLQTLRTKIETHALTLARDNWNNTCDEMRGQLSTKKVWHILRALLDPRTTKTQSRHQTTQIIADTQLSPTALCDTLRSIYIPPPSSHPVGPPQYTGNPNPQLDAPLTFAEVEAAVQALKRNTTPGHYNITNTILRHLNEEVLEHLVQLFNQHWLNHTLPSTWKHSNITLIPKPGKKPSIHNLRPISLTSCLGKLLEHSDPFHMPDRGTPQGAVLSPMLFNLTLIPLARTLLTIPTLRSTLYADDIALWVHSGSDQHIEATLQHGLNQVLHHIEPLELQCSPHKSALLTFTPPRHKPPQNPPIQLFIHSDPIPHTQQIRLLGLTLTHNRSPAPTLKYVKKYVTQTTHLIRRIATKHHGIKEQDRLRLVHSFLLNRILYHLPYLNLTPTQLDSLDALLRKTYRHALLLPPHAPTHRLLDLGIHNTIREHLDAHHMSQLTRLASSPTGHYILDTINILPPTVPIPPPPHSTAHT